MRQRLPPAPEDPPMREWRAPRVDRRVGWRIRARSRRASSVRRGVPEGLPHRPLSQRRVGEWRIRARSRRASSVRRGVPEGLPRPSISQREIGGEAGIRTLGTAFRPYNGLANRRLQPLGHLTAPLSIRLNKGWRKAHCRRHGEPHRHARA